MCECILPAFTTGGFASRQAYVSESIASGSRRVMFDVRELGRRKHALFQAQISWAFLSGVVFVLFFLDIFTFQKLSQELKEAPGSSAQYKTQQSKS